MRARRNNLVSANEKFCDRFAVAAISFQSLRFWRIVTQIFFHRRNSFGWQFAIQISVQILLGGRYRAHVTTPVAGKS
jgi:hypothetical protein